MVTGKARSDYVAWETARVSDLLDGAGESVPSISYGNWTLELSAFWSTLSFCRRGSTGITACSYLESEGIIKYWYLNALEYYLYKQAINAFKRVYPRSLSPPSTLLHPLAFLKFVARMCLRCFNAQTVLQYVRSSNKSDTLIPAEPLPLNIEAALLISARICKPKSERPKKRQKLR